MGDASIAKEVGTSHYQRAALPVEKPFRSDFNFSKIL